MKLRIALVPIVVLAASHLASARSATAPPPPAPEPIAVEELPLPPTAPSDAVGACTGAVNPRGTGCIGAAQTALQSGSFLPDGHHVVAAVRFKGAPAAPDRSAIYDGDQLVLVKIDHTTFSNGDAWKCVTCGVPSANSVGVDHENEYPQTFRDGKRMLAGSHIVDCSPFLLTDDRCTPDKVHLYPIRWNVRADGAGPGGSMRELRLHPDDVHLGFNSVVVKGGKLDQFGYLARLELNPAPRVGEPLVPRYELTHVTRLFQEGLDKRTVSVDPKGPGHLRLNEQAIEVGEFRGFSKNGREVFYVGFPVESSNIDLFAADLGTGKVRRLTSDPEYADPLDSSPDDKWIVVEDTRGSNRQMFVAGMRGIPPITDVLTSSAVSSVRNNGLRRFFQPFLIDRYGDRGLYVGQQLNAGDGSPGSASDPNWNARSDPRWSPDGTSVVYWQALVSSPACGGVNPLRCPDSTEPGGRRSRLMLARLTSRKPLSLPPPAPISDTVRWGTVYEPGSAFPSRASIPPGTYVLKGKVSGEAKVQIADKPDHSGIDTISVAYTNYSDDRIHVINGTERVGEQRVDPLTTHVDWFSDLVETGAVHASKKTSADGFHLTINIMKNILEATGTLTTTVDGHEYKQPANGT